ncbi:MAG: transporter [Candidatus Kapabacteria bacterium]|nr:transporter [Candidatus Kapabacteria bacterium]
MKQYQTITVTILACLFCAFKVHTQCPCMGGASVGGLTPIAGTSNIGILKEGNLRAMSFYSYSNGNRYYSGDILAEEGLVKSFNSSYLGLLIGYGILEDLTIDTEIGYYLNKAQDFGGYTLSGSGFSHATLYGKYNAFNSRAKEFEWTIGLGAKIPLNFIEQNLPQNIQSSTGAFGAVLISYFHKGYKSEGLHFILVNRAEFNAENKNTYKYGSSLINSLFVTKSIFDKLTGMLEFRSDLKLKDTKYGVKNEDSGWNIFVLSPQLSYSLSDFNISAYFDIPLYKYYNGKQLTNKNSLGLTFTWQNNLLKGI